MAVLQKATLHSFEICRLIKCNARRRSSKKTDSNFGFSKYSWGFKKKEY